MNIGLLIRSPEELPSARAANKHAGGEENRAQLLELRTESGTLYVCPSRWQRIRLLWVFRHFHFLSSQVLSRSEQLLIEELSRSALVKPPLPVARDTVFGVIERVSTKSAGRRADSSSGSASIHEAVAKMYGATDRDRGEGFQQWGALGMLITVCLVVILARVAGVPLLARTAHTRKPPAISGPIGQAAIRISPSTVPRPRVETPKHRVTPLEAEPTFVARKPTSPESAPLESVPPGSGSGGSKIDSSSAAAPIESGPASPSGGSERLLVSELPQGDLVEPVVSDPTLVGELHLRALISTDGSVKEVTVVSGNPKLAEAGMRAVLRWHYSPYQTADGPGEAETLIRMRFFGQDAVSITSAAR